MEIEFPRPSLPPQRTPRGTGTTEGGGTRGITGTIGIIEEDDKRDRERGRRDLAPVFLSLLVVLLLLLLLLSLLRLLD
jgi:hypothetical protein